MDALDGAKFYSITAMCMYEAITLCSAKIHYRFSSLFGNCRTRSLCDEFSTLASVYKLEIDLAHILFYKLLKRLELTLDYPHSGQ